MLSSGGFASTKIFNFLLRAFLTKIKNKTPKNVTDKMIISIVLIIQILTTLNK